MAIPNGSGGFQLGDGNINEATFGVIAAQAVLTAGATLSVADLMSGIIVYTAGGANNLTLPTVDLLEATLSSTKVGSVLPDIALVATGAGVPTILVGTGWTLVGTGVGVASKSVLYRAVKTGTGTWKLYRIAG